MVLYEIDNTDFIIDGFFPEPVKLFIWTSIRYLLVTVVQIIWNECYIFHHIFYIIGMTSASNII